MSEKRIMVVCPVCSKSGRIPVPTAVITEKDSGATSVYIPRDLVCPHEFYAYIDKNFKVRDYLVLEYSLKAEALKIKSKLNFLLKKKETFDISLKNLLNFINERDFRSLLLSCFVESPILFIEDDLDSERFGVLFNALAWFFPKMPETCIIMNPPSYLEFNDKQSEKLKNYSIFNVLYKISVQKPFGDSSSEAFQEVLDSLREKDSKLSLIYAKNTIDYILKFTDEFESMNTDDKNFQKIMKKKYPDQENLFSFRWIEVMHLRKDLWKEPEAKSETKAEAKAEKPKIDHLYFYNSAIHVRTAENQDTDIKKHVLQIIRGETVVSMAGIINHLEKRAYERTLEFDYNLVPDILEEFKDKGYITIT
ncbi:hypothetical protein DSAG12_02292 [Promethearchaeum syntrophicum]|uniref:Uncharacterized protein n=1 Tax=Promethearchaeum syntrophicum TaxID=2594042 RepID=A0A5B9DBG9_9ARCH|nr:hypothetical protein [Candidatus Prometheoarchaeum syntrophicum]QEE16462.1 hypothetical protein DSAG12_02292 [Candidatus Prometheoarchaeum syntrophicum]